jgi:hypothetical protein
MPSARRSWLLSAGKRGYRAGRLHVQIKRAFAANAGRQLTTTALLLHCYPRVRKLNWGHYRSVWRAASAICVCLGRQPNMRGRPNLWALKPPPAAKPGGSLKHEIHHFRPVIVGQGRCVGHLILSAKGWRALDRDDREVGVFGDPELRLASDRP